MAISVAEYFELSDREARTIAAEVGRAVAGWRQAAARHGLQPPAIGRMASAFEHEDLDLAISWGRR